MASPATDASTALLTELVALGVRDIVVSPGSRSQALALAAVALADAGRARVHVRIDERVAGFTALGMGRESRVPAVVVCTSGTAVAELLPAALEAHHAGVPLLILTADRPPELRGIGANQTTRQTGLFGPAARWATDAVVPSYDEDGALVADYVALAREAYAAAIGRGGHSFAPGPAHLNLPFREPLSAPEPTVAAARAFTDVADSSGAMYQGGGGIGTVRAAATDPAAEVLERGPRTIVIAGADAGPDAERIAWEGGWPLVAEIVSGARYGRLLVHGYRAALADPERGGAIERVVVLGHPTLSREVVRVLSRADIEIVAVRGPGEIVNYAGTTRAVDAIAVASEPAASDADASWRALWLQTPHAPDLDPPAPDAAGLASADPAARRRAVEAELDAARRGIDRAGLVDAVWRASWPHDRLVFGSSRLVRVADEVLAGKKVPVHANRGLAGIDGTIATATGIALSSQASGAPGVTRLLLGDLAFLHDVGALLHPADEPEPRLQVIVGNDGGGTIFDGLEIAATAPPAVMDRVLYTPHQVRLEQLALAYGWEYTRATSRQALDAALVRPVGGRQLIEVPLER